MPNYRVDFAKEILGVPFTVGSVDIHRAATRNAPAAPRSFVSRASTASETGVNAPISPSSPSETEHVPRPSLQRGIRRRFGPARDAHALAATALPP